MMPAQPRKKRAAGIILDGDVDEDDEDSEDTEAVVPGLVGGLDLDKIIDSSEATLPSTFEGARPYC